MDSEPWSRVRRQVSNENATAIEDERPSKIMQKFALYNATGKFQFRLTSRYYAMSKTVVNFLSNIDFRSPWQGRASILLWVARTPPQQRHHPQTQHTRGRAYHKTHQAVHHARCEVRRWRQQRQGL